MTGREYPSGVVASCTIGSIQLGITAPPSAHPETPNVTVDVATVVIGVLEAGVVSGKVVAGDVVVVSVAWAVEGVVAGMVDGACVVAKSVLFSAV